MWEALLVNTQSKVNKDTGGTNLSTLSSCLGVRIKCRIRLILRLIIYFIFGKLHFGLDYVTKFKFSHKIMGLVIPI